MSQVIPSPQLLSLEAGDTFLYAEWKNNPYIDIYNAYLLVVNTTDYTDIRYIYLTQEEALDEAMKIDNLVNDIFYLVQYTQTQVAPDGVQGNSNVQLEKPVATPRPPTILTDDQYSVIIEKNSSNYTIKVWLDYGDKSYDPSLEKTVFKIITEQNPDILSRTFDVSSQQGRYKQFTLTNLSKDNYAISCFNVNQNGVGRLSNVIEVDVGETPFVTNVTSVESGLDGKLRVYVSTRQNNMIGFNIQNFNIYYAIPSANGQPTWLNGGSLSNLTVDNGFVTADGFVTGLTNGEKYLIKAVAVNVNGEGLSANEGKGVPAKKSAVSNVAITKANANGGVVQASWSKIDGTFGPTSYKYKLIDGLRNTTIREDTVSENSISLTGLVINAGEKLKLSVTPADTITTEILAYWITPELQQVSNNWVGETVTTELYTINNKPHSLTSFVCSSVGDGSLTYTFVKPVSFDYDAPSKYTIQLSTSSNFVIANIVQTVDITDMTLLTKTFNGLTNNVDYYAKIVASNDFGDSDVVKTTSANQPLLNIGSISGLIGPSQLNTPVSTDYPNLYDLTIDWASFTQVGYTLVNYTVKIYTYNENDTYTFIEGENTVTSAYTYQATIGTRYAFGITVNANIDQFVDTTINSVVNSSETKSQTILVSGRPYINPDNIVFGIQPDNNNKGTISFTVDGRYSTILGLFTLVLPLSEDSVENKTDIFQTQPLYYTLTDSANVKTYTADLHYKIPRVNQAYIIYAVNSIGVSYISSGLSVNPNANLGGGN